MDKNEFKARVSMAFDGIPTWEDFLEKCWQVHCEELAQLGWHHGSERPLPATGKKIIVYYKDADGVSCSHTSFLTNLYEWHGVPAFVQDNLMWCYPPEKEERL